MERFNVARNRIITGYASGMIRISRKYLAQAVDLEQTLKRKEKVKETTVTGRFLLWPLDKFRNHYRCEPEELGEQGEQCQVQRGLPLSPSGSH